MPTQTGKTVAIIGGGLAGLSAARQLSRRGFETVVFEARPRVGGRVCTLRSPFRDNQFAEAGAARFGSDHTTTLKYVRELQLPIASFYPSGGRIVLCRNDTRCEVDGEQPPYQSHGLVTGGEPVSPSIWGVLADRLSLPLAPPAWFKISGGTDQFPAALADQLPNVFINTPVSTVHQHAAGVTVHYLSEDRSTQTIDVDYVICTAPLTVLDTIEFLPELSGDKQHWMKAIKYQSACRCFFQVTERFWNARGHNGFASSDLLGEVWHPTFDQAGKRGVLVTYCQGPLAEAMARLPEAERIERVTSLLDRVHPGIRDAVETAVTYHWTDDPWSRGAQSLAWDLTDDELGELGRPEGRVHFAGEHTAPRRWLGWINGALLSGERVAREISRRVKGPKARRLLAAVYAGGK